MVFPDDYRAPLPCETRVYELSGYTATGRFRKDSFIKTVGPKLVQVFDTEIAYQEVPTIGRQRRLIEHVRTLTRKDNLTALLELGQLEPRALVGESLPNGVHAWFAAAGIPARWCSASAYTRQRAWRTGWRSRRLHLIPAAQGGWAVSRRGSGRPLVDPLGPGAAVTKRRRHGRAGTRLRAAPLLPAPAFPRPLQHGGVQHRKRRHL